MKNILHVTKHIRQIDNTRATSLELFYNYLNFYWCCPLITGEPQIPALLNFSFSHIQMPWVLEVENDGQNKLYIYISETYSVVRNLLSMVQIFLIT